jgi:hypothetical protein
VAQRLSDAAPRQGGSVSAAGEDGLNTVMVIQVPLQYKPRPTRGVPFDMMLEAAPMMKSSEVEDAVISHGEVEGPFKELAGLTIERDPRFPVRVTVQFYKATATGTISDADVASIRTQIDRVYREGDYAGSLVSSGYTGRPTEWTHPRPIWADPVFSSL